MNYKGIIKKQSFIITASIIVMAIILLGTSYALFTNKDNSDTQVVQSGTLIVSYTGSTITTVGGTDGTGNLLEIEPLDEGTVNTLTPYTIKVQNNGTLALKYNIIIYTGETNTLPHSYYSFKYKNNGTYTQKATLTTLPKVDPSKTNMNEIKYKLTSEPFVLEPGQEATHEMYLWIDEDLADETISNKIANINAAVEGEATSATPNYNIVSGNLNRVGSVVKIADEEFYVIGQEDDTHVKLLSKWNLNVGSTPKGTATGLQDSDVRGKLFTSSPGYYEGAEKYGTIAFSSTNYWFDGTGLESEYGSSYPAFIYTNVKENGSYIASIAEYVDNYVTYLTNQGVIVSGRLINHDEIESLGCNDLSGGCSTTYEGTAPEWVYQTSYWTGFAFDDENLWYVYSNGRYGEYRNDGPNLFGVRPVIILQK